MKKIIKKIQRHTIIQFENLIQEAKLKKHQDYYFSIEPALMDYTALTAKENSMFP